MELITQSFSMNLLKIWIIPIACKKCQYLWQLNQPIEELAFNLYEKIIDKDESFEKVKIQKNLTKIGLILNLI